MSQRRSEPAELHGFKKEVTKAKEGPLELSRRAKVTYLRGERHGCAPERVCLGKERDG